MTDDLYQEVVPGDLIYNDGQAGVVFGETPSGEIRYLHARMAWRREAPNEVEISKTYSRANHYNFKITEEQLRHYLLGPHQPENRREENTEIITKLLEAQQDILIQ